MYSINPYVRESIADRISYTGDVPFDQFVNPNPSKLGRHVSKVRPRLARYFNNIITPEDPVPTGSPLLQSLGGFDSLVGWGRSWLDLIDKTTMIPVLKEAEKDNVSKIVLLNGNPGSAHIEPAGLSQRHQVIPESIDAVANLLLGLRDNSAPSMTTARGTNHGWPTYLPGNSTYNSVDLVAHLKLSTILMDRFKGDLEPFADYVTREVGLSEPVSATMFFRRMPTGKSTHIYNLQPSGPAYRYTETGKWCRMRQVFGVPLFMNSAMRRGAGAVKLLYRSLPNFYHTTPQRTLSFLQEFKDFTWFSEDISGYDKSVSIHFQEAVADRFYRHILTDEELRLYLSSQRLPVLSPPLSSRNPAFLYSREGQTVSGSIWTDKDGTIFNFMRIVDCVARATGWTVESTVQRFNQDWSCLVFGDDCVIGYRATLSFKIESYTERSLELGFKTEFYPGIIFLMNVYDLERNVWYGVLSRAVDKTFNKEYPVSDAILALYGDAARWSRLTEHPYVDRGWGFIQSRGWHSQLGYTSIKGLTSVLSDPVVLKTMVALAENANKAAAVRDTMAGLTHGSLSIDDIGNTVLTGRSLVGVERLLAGLTIDEDSLRPQVSEMSDSNLFKFIHWTQDGSGKPNLT